MGTAGTSGTDGGPYPGELNCGTDYSQYGYPGDCHRWACFSDGRGGHVVRAVIDDSQMAPICGGGESLCCRGGALAQSPTCCQ